MEPILAPIKWIDLEEAGELFSRPISLADQVQARIDTEGISYTAEIWKMLKAKDKTLTAEQAEAYQLIQRYHFEQTGYQLPPLKGARMTKAQIRDDEGPVVKEEVIEASVKKGLAATLAAMRNKGV